MTEQRIKFDGIPSSIRKPGIYSEFDYKTGQYGIPANKQKVLIVGQKTSAGTATALTPEQIFSAPEAAIKYGYGSIAHLMVRAMLKAGRYTDITVISQSDLLAGVQASGTVTIAGPATSSGMLTLYVGTEDIQIPITSADTAANIAAALKAELDLHPDLPVTASVALAVVTLTAKHKGVVGNSIPVGYALTNAAGVTCTIAAMSAGAGDPDIEDALEVVYGERYPIIVSPYADQTSLTSLRTHLNSVSNGIEMRGAVGIYGMTGALSAATTLAGQINSERLMGGYLRYTSATIRQAIPFELASAIAAVRAFEEDPGLSVKRLELVGIPAPAVPDRLSRTEQEACLYGGAAPCEVIPGEKVALVRDVSTYIENSMGVPDPTLLDITTVMALDYVRQAMAQSDSNRFSRVKKSKRVKDAINTNHIAVALILEDAGIVQNVMDHKDDFYWENDPQDATRANFNIPASIVPNLHVLAQRIQLYIE